MHWIDTESGQVDEILEIINALNQSAKDDFYWDMVNE